MTCGFCSAPWDSCPWHWPPPGKEAQARRGLRRQPASPPRGPGHHLAASPRRPRVRTQKRERACCSLELPRCLRRRGSRQLSWGPSALVSSRFSGRTGVLSPFVHSERAGAAEPAGPNAQLGWEAHGHTVARDSWEPGGHRPSAGLAPEPWRKTRSPSLGFQRGAPALLSHNHTRSPPREGHAACEQDPQSRAIRGSLPASPPN